MYTMGIDMGSSHIKGAILKDGIHYISLVNTTTDITNHIFETMAEQCGLIIEDLAYIVVTGIRQKQIMFAEAQMNEIRCQTRGVISAHSNARTIIDLGHLNTNTIKVDYDGNVVRTIINEKSIIGTGQFLSIVANVLDIPIKQMGEVQDRFDICYKLKNTSLNGVLNEIQALRTGGASIQSIIYAVQTAMAERICSIASHIGIRPPVVVTGGVAQGVGIIRAIERVLSRTVTVPMNPQLTGAVGAALLAYEMATT